MTLKKPCTECKHFVKSTSECTNIEAEYYMINGIPSIKVGCEKQEEGKCEIE